MRILFTNVSLQMCALVYIVALFCIKVPLIDSCNIDKFDVL